MFLEASLPFGKKEITAMKLPWRVTSTDVVVKENRMPGAEALGYFRVR